MVLVILLSLQGLLKVGTSCMACRGSAVRIRLAPFLKTLPLEGFSSIWGDIFVRIALCLARLLARKSDKTLRRSVISRHQGGTSHTPIPCRCATEAKDVI